jgi:hypothetical protein
MWISVSPWSTAAQAGQLHTLMAEMMLDSKLDDREIFRQLVLESRSGMESRVQGSGHSVVGAYTRPLFSSTWAVSDTKAHPKHP